jgi:hypothetical protein
MSINNNVKYMLELKAACLEVAGIKYMNPGDCGILSDLIFQVTNKRISVTTLKRLYGFAAPRLKTSLYTISALQEFSQMETIMTKNSDDQLCQNKLHYCKIENGFNPL